jgi:hypothetical protein
MREWKGSGLVHRHHDEHQPEGADDRGAPPAAVGALANGVAYNIGAARRTV